MSDTNDYQLVSEHQPMDSEESAKTAAYEPSTEEKADIKLVTKYFERAKKYREKYDRNWVKWYHFFRGKQWQEARPSYRHSEVINMVWQHIQSTVPITTDSRPKFEFLPEDPSDRELAEIFNEISESDWQRNNWGYTLTEIVYDGNIYGTGHSSMEHDGAARYGLGDIVYKRRDTFYAFPDPNSLDVNDKSRGGKFFIYAEPVDIDVLKKQYPDKAAFIKSDLLDLSQNDKNNIDAVKYKSPVDNRTIMEGPGGVDDNAERNQALKIECYIYDDDTEEEVEEFEDQTSIQIDPMTGQEVQITQQVSTGFVQKKKYPNGRKICVAAGVLLDSGPIPYDDGQAPFEKLINYIDPGSYWGISEIEQLESPQKIFNKVLSFALDTMTLMGNPIWVVGEQANVDTDNLINRPGVVIEASDANQVRREGGVQINPDLFQLIDRMRNYFNEASGSTEATRGVRPEGITAMGAITALQEAAQTRIRLKSRLLDNYLQTLGQHYKARVFQFYSTPRVIRITNNQNAQKYFKFHVEQVQDEMGNTKKVARVRGYQEDEMGKMKPEMNEREYIINGDFDIRVNTGSSLPFAKTEKINVAKMLFDAGAIDQQELLVAADYPNWEQVMERMKSAAMAQQPPPQDPNAAPMPPPQDPNLVPGGM